MQSSFSWLLGVLWKCKASIVIEIAYTCSFQTWYSMDDTVGKSEIVNYSVWKQVFFTWTMWYWKVQESVLEYLVIYLKDDDSKLTKKGRNEVVKTGSWFVQYGKLSNW